MENIKKLVTTPGRGNLKMVYYLGTRTGIIVRAESGCYYIVGSDRERCLTIVKVTGYLNIYETSISSKPLVRDLLYNYHHLKGIRNFILSENENFYPFGIRFIDDILKIIRDNVPEERSLQLLKANDENIDSIIEDSVKDLEKEIEEEGSKWSRLDFDYAKQVEYLGNLKFVSIGRDTYLITSYNSGYALFTHMYGDDYLKVYLMRPEEYASMGLSAYSIGSTFERDLIKRLENEEFREIRIEVDGDLIFTDKSDSSLIRVLRKTLKDRFIVDSFRTIDEGTTDVDNSRAKFYPLETKVGDKLKILKFKEDIYDITGVLMYDNWSDRYILFGQDLKMDRATFIVMDDELIEKLVEVPSDELAITRMKRFYSDFVDFPEKRYCDNVRDEDYRATNNTLYKIRSILRADGRFSDEEIYR